MNTISLEARKRMIAEDIPNVNDASALEKKTVYLRLTKFEKNLACENKDCLV